MGIIAASGDTIWTFGVDHGYSTDLSATAPKLRDLAKKILAPERR